MEGEEDSDDENNGTSSSVECEEEDGDICCCCLVRPCTLRYRPCGHAVCCELCTIEACTPRHQLLRCPTCRQAVEQLEVTNSGVETSYGTAATRRYEAAAQRGARRYESLQAFLQAMISYGRPPIIDSAAQEVAAAAQAMHDRWNGDEGGEEGGEQAELAATVVAAVIAGVLATAETEGEAVAQHTVWQQ